MTRNIVKTFKIVCTIYVGALLLSWCIQYFFPTSDKENLYQSEKSIVVADSEIGYSYYSLGVPNSKGTIILIPDLFGGPEFLLPLARSLQDSLHVIIPEYPKSARGGSLSFSINNRAKYLNVLADSLNLDQTHLLGHGYGGLIAIDLASDSISNRFKSLTLVSSYGTQELQFLGNHLINKSLYSMLYPVVTVFKYLVPHMGWYYEQPVDYNFAKTLTAIDQRQVRDQLQQIEMPVHILQPMKDRYVSLAISKEIYRIVPHSSFFVIQGNHITTKENPIAIAPHIINFTNRVEKGLAETRTDAEPGRVEKSLEPFDAENFETVAGSTLIIIMLLLAFISLFSEDLACVAGGLLVAGGIIDFWFAVIGACIGVLGADVILYGLGRYIGNPILGWIPFRWFIKEEDIVKAEKMYRMKGVEIIFATRFLPGTRLPVYLVSGMISVKFTFFLFYFVLAMIIWAPLLVWISALIGQPMISYIASYQEHAIWLIPLIIGVLFVIVKGITLVSTPTGRRRVVVRFGRFREKYLSR